MLKKTLTALVAILLAGGGIGFAFYTTRETEAGAPPAFPRTVASVKVARVERGPIRETMRYMGRVRAAESVTIVPKVTGILKQITFDMGDRVQKGDLIARIDDSEFAQRVKQAKANLQLAEAQLERGRIALASAEREYKRTGVLSSQGLVTEQDLDTALSTFDTARADVALAEAETARAAAALEEAQINFENTRIVSPLTGYVDKRAMDPGALASPTTPLCTIVQTDPAKIAVNVPENDIELAEAGRAVTVSVPGLAVTHQGRVDRVSPTVNTATHTTEVEIVIPNPERTLRPGMSTEVTFVVKEALSALFVPETALQRGAADIEVFRVSEDRAYRVPVKVGLVSDGRAEVLDGLDEGDLVIVKGQFLIEDGDPIQYTVLRDAEAT